MKCIDDRRAQGTLIAGTEYTVLKERNNVTKAGTPRKEYLIINEHGNKKWYDVARFESTPTTTPTVSSSTVTSIFKVGDKVYPVSKTAPGYELANVEYEPNWKTSKERGYFFIGRIDNKNGQVLYACTSDQWYNGGNYYTEEDLRHYVEPKEQAKKENAEMPVEKRKVTLKSFLQDQGVPGALVQALIEYRKTNKVDESVVSRVIRKPSSLYIGGEVWTTCIAALLNGSNILLEGEKATGKNVLAENLAFAFGRPMWDISMHVNIDSSALVGSETFKNNEVTFRPGSVHNVATYGGFGVLDEINMAKNEAVAVLHAILDDRGVVDVPGYDRIYLNEASRFIGTMNHGYVGTRELNEALVSRFVVIHVPQLDREGLKALLNTKFDGLKQDTLNYFVRIFTDLQLKAKNGEISTRTVDLRGLIDALGLIDVGVKPTTAVTSCIVNKAFDTYERTKVQDLVDTLIQKGWTRANVFKNTPSNGDELVVDFTGVK